MSFVVGGVALGAAAIAAGGAAYAAHQQSKAANNATKAQQGMYDQTYAGEAPYRDIGSQSAAKLSDLLGTSDNTGAAGYGSLSRPFTSQDYLNNQDPGYQFQLQQGQQALQNSQAAHGGVLSGSALKDLINYNQGVAATGYQNAWNRWNTQQNNTVSRLGSLAQLGESAASNQASGASTFAGGIANTITGAGANNAAGTIGAANALTSGANNAAGYYYLSQNTGNPYASSGLTGNNSTGYTYTDPSSVGPTPGP
jgi:hypothetical protein